MQKILDTHVFEKLSKILISAQTNYITYMYTKNHDFCCCTCFFTKVKNDLEATVLCMTALGVILLQQNKLEEVKVIVRYL